MADRYLNLGSSRRLPLIRQTEAAECGLACLAMVASYHGHRIDLNTLRREHPVSMKGVTLRGLIQVAGHLHLAARPLRFELEHLRQLRLPAIVHWDMHHFVVLKSVRGRIIDIYDPAEGERRLNLKEASRHLTGVALELTPAEGFRRRDERSRLPLRAFWAGTEGLPRTLAEVFVLSVALELLALAAPFYMQITLDEVIVRDDADLLLVLALGFGLLAAIRVGVTALRARVMLILQNALHFQIGARLFRHLLRLPLAWFEKRHIGDILTRFGSVEPVRNLLAQDLVAALLDGIMGFATLGMIVAYSPPLAAIVLTTFVICAGLRVALFARFRVLNEAAIQAKAQESSIFIETVRAVQSLKLHNREEEREGQWLNRFAESVNANLRVGRMQIGFHAINDGLYGLSNIILVYVAARLALANVLTVGMVFAFMSYKQQFEEKALQLVDKALDLSVLALHRERLADIALAQVERGIDRPPSYPRAIEGGLVLRDICFRYSETEPFVLENINLTVPAGQFLTIMGPSGGGKTTLMKIMLGLLEPTSGEVLIDGIPLATLGARTYREYVAAVMQDDQLLSGTIADNICFFDPASDQGRMMECAVLAGIHDEIMSMPMNYGSLIGDMGSSLSGGQKQRVLLARALYRQPRILFLDEGTAHLDTECERFINESLRRLPMTRISIAHRPEITSGADAVLRIERARILTHAT